MSIVQVFNPETGAATGGGSGGGPAPGGSLYDVPWDGPIDLTDGSWTLVDPSSIVKSVAFAGGFNTITFNALTVTNQDYNWTSGSNILAPRWYKKIIVDGNQVTTDDLSNAMFYLEADNGTRFFDNVIVNGICEDPTSTNLNGAVKGTGATINAVKTNSTTALGVWTVNGSATTTSGTNVRIQTQSLWGARYTGSTTFTMLDASGFRVQNGSRNSSTALTATTDANWIIGPGTRGVSSITLDDKVRFKAYHKAIKMGLGAIL